MLIKLYIFYSAPTQIQTETLALSLWIMDCSKLGCQWKPQQMFHLINNIVWMVKVLNIRELKGHQFHSYILRAILYRDYFKRKFYPKMITQSKIKCRKALLFHIDQCKKIKSLFGVLMDLNLGNTNLREDLKCALGRTNKGRAYKGKSHNLEQRKLLLAT